MPAKAEADNARLTAHRCGRADPVGGDGAGEFKRVLIRRIGIHHDDVGLWRDAQAVAGGGSGACGSVTDAIRPLNLDLAFEGVIDLVVGVYSAGGFAGVFPIDRRRGANGMFRFVPGIVIGVPEGDYPWRCRRD